MQGRSERQRQLGDVEAWAGHLLLRPGSMFAFLAAHRLELFPDALFADLFPSGRGRRSVPADVVATVLVLQALHGLSDWEAADSVTFDLRWKAAAGLPLEAVSFHPTTLTYWRRRLAASHRPNRIFEVVRRPSRLTDQGTPPRSTDLGTASVRIDNVSGSKLGVTAKLTSSNPRY